MFSHEEGRKMLIKVKDLLPGMCGIYKITYPNGKIYIGLSRDIRRRMYEHNNAKRLATHYNSPCDLAIQKYGQITEIEILEFVSDNTSLLSERERYWIKFYHSNDKTIGYNLTEGGEFGLIGEKAAGAVFSNQEVLDIRKRRFFGERKRDVYQDYKNRSFNSFENVWLGNGYPNIGQEYLIPKHSISRQEYSSIANSGERNNKAKLTNDKVKAIRQRYDAGESYQSIAKDYQEVTQNSIRRVCLRETWKNI